jgi:hypothetical protein
MTHTKNMAINDMTSDLSVKFEYWGKYNCNNTGMVSPITKASLKHVYKLIHNDIMRGISVK